MIQEDFSAYFKDIKIAWWLNFQTKSYGTRGKLFMLLINFYIRCNQIIDIITSLSLVNLVFRKSL